MVSEAGSGGVDSTVQTEQGPSSDKDELLAFVQSLRRLVRAALERPGLFAPYDDLLREAGRELPRRFDDLTIAIERLSPDAEELVQHGLTGNELKLKLRVYYDAQERFLETLDLLDAGTLWTILTGHPAPHVPLDYDFDDVTEAADVAVKRKQRLHRRLVGVAVRTVKKIARHPLEMGDLILRTVGSAVPGAGVATGPIGEIKGTMELILGAE